MSFNKRVLENKSNQELEKYIEQGNRFVTEANLCAFEILKSRGREFTDEETQLIFSLIEEKQKKEQILIHPNHKNASELIYISGLLGIVNFILLYNTFDGGSKVFISITSIVFVFVIGYLIRTGMDWLKYFLLCALALGIVGIPTMITNLINEPIVGIINLIQKLLQLGAMVLLFLIPKPSKS